MKKYLKWYILGFAILGVWTCSTLTSIVSIVPGDTQIELSEPKRKLLTNILRSKDSGKSRFRITLEIDGHEASYQQAFEEKQFNAKAEWVDEETVSVDFIHRDSGETFQTITLRHLSDSPTLELIASH